MNMRTCSRQDEVLAMLARGHWPRACSPELRTHLDGCRSCAELLVVTQAFQQSRTAASAEARLPAPGAIWWRAQLRRRNAAIERVSKPIVGAYIFALSIALAVAAVIAISQARNGLRWLEGLGQAGSAALHSDSLNPSAWLNSFGSLVVLIPVLATAALVGAVVVYLTAERQ
jgi:hypothetical protein